VTVAGALAKAVLRLVSGANIKPILRWRSWWASRSRARGIVTGYTLLVSDCAVV
jgi:hypothetical protein